MTAIFYDRKRATHRRFDDVDQLKFGMEDINGRHTRIIYVFLPYEAVTLKQSEFELVLVYK